MRGLGWGGAGVGATLVILGATFGWLTPHDPAAPMPEWVSWPTAAEFNAWTARIGCEGTTVARADGRLVAAMEGVSECLARKQLALLQERAGLLLHAEDQFRLRERAEARLARREHERAVDAAWRRALLREGRVPLFGSQPVLP